MLELPFTSFSLPAVLYGIFVVSEFPGIDICKIYVKTAIVLMMYLRYSVVHLSKQGKDIFAVCWVPWNAVFMECEESIQEMWQRKVDFLNQLESVFHLQELLMEILAELSEKHRFCLSMIYWCQELLWSGHKDRFVFIS